MHPHPHLPLHLIYQQDCNTDWATYTHTLTFDSLHCGHTHTPNLTSPTFSTHRNHTHTLHTLCARTAHTHADTRTHTHTQRTHTHTHTLHQALYTPTDWQRSTHHTIHCTLDWFQLLAEGAPPCHPHSSIQRPPYRRLGLPPAPAAIPQIAARDHDIHKCQGCPQGHTRVEVNTTTTEDGICLCELDAFVCVDWVGSVWVGAEWVLLHEETGTETCSHKDRARERAETGRCRGSSLHMSWQTHLNGRVHLYLDAMCGYALCFMD